MTKEEIFIKVQNQTADLLGLDTTEIEINSKFMNDLGCDSLMLLELIVEFENKFQMTIPDNEADRLTTISDVVEYVHKRMHKA